MNNEYYKHYLRLRIKDLTKIRLKAYIWRVKTNEKTEYSHSRRNGHIFYWNASGLRPGEKAGCECYAEFIDKNYKQKAVYGKIGYIESDGDNDEILQKKIEVISDSLEDLETEKSRLQALEFFISSDELRENVKKGEEIKNKGFFERCTWMRDSFKKRGDLRLRNYDPLMKYIENFNYGAIGKAAGFENIELKLGVGIYQTLNGSSKNHFTPSYFNNPTDWKYIQKGVEWYEQNYSK
ncbi:polymorphic toxin type 44 domain-containing protein [Pseudomonadota bacterium]